MENLSCNIENNFMLGCSGSGRAQGIVFFSSHRGMVFEGLSWLLLHFQLFLTGKENLRLGVKSMQ